MISRYEKIGRVSETSVLKCTGKNWDQWLAILENAGARGWTHGEIALFLKKKYKLSPWWQQGVTHGFELATGRKEEGKNAKGDYMLTATKSFPISAKKLWKLIVSEKGLAIWLKPLFPVSVKVKSQFETEDGFYGEFRTLKKDRRIRLTWQDPEWAKKTTVQLHLVARPGERSLLVFGHEQIRELTVQTRMRRRWKTAASELQELARRILPVV